MIVRVARSPLRLLGYALVAAPLILLAVDMLVAYKWYPRPETTVASSTEVTTADGSVTQVTSVVYTDNGKAQRRRDLAWGVVLGAGGAALLGWAFTGLVRPQRLLAADAEGLSLWLEGRRRPPWRVPWQEVAEVRSGIRRDEAGEVPVLSLRLPRADGLPARPRGASVELPWLHLYANEWDHPAHEVSALLEGYVTGFRGWEAYG
jgi:hypothetical protein